MTFNDKFKFLMDITNTSNTTLASAVGIDNSAVSLYRNGKRKCPRNKEVLKKMADYFAGSIKLNYQRKALALAADYSRFNHSRPVSEYSQMLYLWLTDELPVQNDLVDSILNENVSSSSTDYIQGIRTIDVVPNATSVLYRSEGKKQSILSFVNYLLTLDNPKTIYVWVDDDVYSIFDNKEIIASLHELIIRLLDYGYEICQISPSPVNTTQFFEEFFYWVPAYLTGRVKSYYYPRMRDNLFSKISIVYPGYAAVYSDSLSSIPDKTFTVLTAESAIVSIKEIEFKTFLSYCRPTMNIYESAEDVSTCFHRFLSTPVAHIQKGLSLPPATMPDELVTQFLNDNPDSLGVSMRIAYQRDKMYDNLRNVDICPLATVNQVLSGRVPVIFPVVKQEVPIYYTPRTYALHLKNILEIMDTYPDYFFVPIEYNPDDNVCIIVNEGSEALLVRTALPSMVLDFNHPQLVQNFQEYLYRIANEIGYADINRRKIRAQIKELINALEKV
jgi:transcriptional regulator with XRE-family HTH domain